MKLARKIICIVLVCVILSGCSSSGTSTPEQNKTLKIVATVFPPFDFARNIVEDMAELTILIPPGAESHSYEPTPKDIIKIQNCDLFLFIGGESDSWIYSILESMGEKAPNSLALIGKVKVVEEEHVDGMHGHATDDKETDEHIWTSVENAKMMTTAIFEKLCEIDTKNSSAFQSNTEKYIKKLDQLDLELRDMLSSSTTNTIVVGDRFPFVYLAKEYGINYSAAFLGCSEQCEPSAATIAYLTDKIRDEKIPVVFYIEFSNHLVADAIAEATGTKTLMLHSAHNLTKQELQSGATYISIMQQNIINLSEALN